MTDTTAAIESTPPATKRPRKMAREPQTKTVRPDADPAPAKRPNKTSLILDLLLQPKGATINQLIEATGWLPHTTRAALTGLKKKGHAVISEKVESVRRYRIDAAAA